MNKVITVYDSEEQGVVQPPKNLLDFIDWLNWKLESVPEEYYKNANLEISSNCYEEVTFKVYYERPETARELHAKKLAKELADKDKRAREFALLKELQEKYKDWL